MISIIVCTRSVADMLEQSPVCTGTCKADWPTDSVDQLASVCGVASGGDDFRYRPVYQRNKVFRLPQNINDE